MKKQTVLFIIILNLTIVAAEIIFGLLAHSMALIADAMHNLGDVLAVVVTYIALIYGAKSPSYRSTYGYHRAEMMAAFVNSLFLFVTMLFILYESLDKLFNPVEVQAGYMIVVALVALIANAISAYLLQQSGVDHHHHHGEHDHHHHEHNHDHHDHGHGDLNIRSAYLHMLGDALISLGVVAGGVAIYYLELYSIDAILSILFTFYILKTTWPVLKQSFQSLMDLNDDNVDQITEIMLGEEPVSGIHDLHVTRPSSSDFHITAHLVFESGTSLEVIERTLESIREKLKSLGVTHTVIQPETKKYETDSLYCSDGSH